MPDMTPVDRESPLWLAWKRYTATDDYANSVDWLRKKNCEAREGDYSGELWAAFMAGFNAGYATVHAGESE